MGEIKVVKDGEGFTYLHTHRGFTAGEIAEAVTPYIGRLVLASIPDESGYPQRHWAELKKVDGEVVALHVPNLGRDVVISVGDAFGSAVTMIEKVLKCEACTWAETNGALDEVTGRVSRPSCTGTKEDPCPGMEKK